MVFGLAGQPSIIDDVRVRVATSSCSWEWRPTCAWPTRRSGCSGWAIGSRSIDDATASPAPHHDVRHRARARRRCRDHLGERHLLRVGPRPGHDARDPGGPCGDDAAAGPHAVDPARQAGSDSTHSTPITPWPAAAARILCRDAHLWPSDAQRVAARSRRHLPEPRNGRRDASPGARAPAGDHRRDRAAAGEVHAARIGRFASRLHRAVADASCCRGGRRVRRCCRRGSDVRRQHHHRRQRDPSLVPVRPRRRDRGDQPRLRRSGERGDLRDAHHRRHVANDRDPTARRRSAATTSRRSPPGSASARGCWSSTTSLPAAR